MNDYFNAVAEGFDLSLFFLVVMFGASFAITVNSATLTVTYAAKAKWAEFVVASVITFALAFLTAIPFGIMLGVWG